MPGKAKPIVKEDKKTTRAVTRFKDTITKTSRTVIVEEEISELQKIVNRVADIRLNEIEQNMLESGLIEEGERHERGTEIYRVFKLWRSQMTNTGLPDLDYLKLKELMIDVFDAKEFDYWMMGTERYLQKILWSVLKQEGFCEQYKIRRTKTLNLMKEDGRWAYVIDTWGDNHNRFID